MNYIIENNISNNFNEFNDFNDFNKFNDFNNSGVLCKLQTPPEIGSSRMISGELLNNSSELNNFSETLNLLDSSNSIYSDYGLSFSVSSESNNLELSDIFLKKKKINRNS